MNLLRNDGAVEKMPELGGGGGTSINPEVFESSHRAVHSSL